VEDEIEIAETLEEILRSNGDQGDIAVNGSEGLARALSTGYDLIISDIRMPELDGPSLYEALRRERPDMLHRIVFITGDALSPEIRRSLNQSGVPYLEKPFLASHVLRLLFEVAGGREAMTAESGSEEGGRVRTA